MSLIFYKEYLFGFETLVFATLGIYAWTACTTPKRKENLKSHQTIPLNKTENHKEDLCLKIYAFIFSYSYLLLKSTFKKT